MTLPDLPNVVLARPGANQGSLRPTDDDWETLDVRIKHFMMDLSEHPQAAEHYRRVGLTFNNRNGIYGFDKPVEWSREKHQETIDAVAVSMYHDPILRSIFDRYCLSPE